MTIRFKFLSFPRKRESSDDPQNIIYPNLLRSYSLSSRRFSGNQGWPADLRQTARLEEFETMSSGYRPEIERMQAEVLEYLLRPVTPEVEFQLA